MKRIKKKGKKRVFGFGPKIIPSSENWYQKDMSSMYTSLTFRPQDYDSENQLQRKKMAFEDAKSHQSFYKKLIKEGVYPPDTKVRVKRLKHSDKFTLEFWMPEINSENYKKKYSQKGEKRQEEIKRDVRKIASEYGYNPPPYRGFDEDLGFPRNYGVDKNGNTYYFDTHVLKNKLPFRRRKKSPLEIVLERKGAAILTLGGFALSILFWTNSITGFIIFNKSQNSSNFLGTIFFLGSLLGVYLIINKRDKTAHQKRSNLIN